MSEEDKDTLCRMADCELTAFSFPARHALSCLRLQEFAHRLEALPAAQQPVLSVRTFPEVYSKQNFVLLAHVDPANLTLEQRVVTGGGVNPSVSSTSWDMFVERTCVVPRSEPCLSSTLI